MANAANAQIAMQHTQQMETWYHDQIKSCQQHVERWKGPGHSVYNDKLHGQPPIQVLLNMDCVTAVHMAKQNNPCARVMLIDFASFRHPGGGFIKGAMAQEEAICHGSTLYNVLMAHQDWYIQHENPKALNKCLYRDEALYCPDIIFPYGQPVVADVLVCAAPNANAYYQQKGTKDVQTVEKAMYSRLRFMCGIAEEKEVDVLITGAFGCGVFGNDPAFVAKHSQHIFGGSNIPIIAYTVPSTNANNYQAFAKRFPVA